MIEGCYFSPSSNLAKTILWISRSKINLKGWWFWNMAILESLMMLLPSCSRSACWHMDLDGKTSDKDNQSFNQIDNLIIQGVHIPDYHASVFVPLTLNNHIYHIERFHYGFTSVVKSMGTILYITFHQNKQTNKQTNKQRGFTNS